MVYESDFYTTRRPYSSYSRPTVTSYSVTTPRHYVVNDIADRPRRAEEQYSYSYSSSSEKVASPSYRGPPTRSYQSSSETVRKATGSGPGSYNYSTERSSRATGDGPGGYHSSYSSTTSGRLPGGTSYRHYAYRV